MCICINCRHINKCVVYAEIKKQHNIVKKICIKGSTFLPYNNTIQINALIHKKTTQIYLDWDLTECLSFIEQPGSWLT